MPPQQHFYVRVRLVMDNYHTKCLYMAQIRFNCQNKAIVTGWVASSGYIDKQLEFGDANIVEFSSEDALHQRFSTSEFTFLGDIEIQAKPGIIIDEPESPAIVKAAILNHQRNVLANRLSELVPPAEKRYRG